MGRTLYTACLLIAGIMMLAGCTDDGLVKNGRKDVVEGVSVTATLKIYASPLTDVVVNTRADNSLSELYDLTLFIFDSEGTFQQTVSTYDNTLTVQGASGETKDWGMVHEVQFKTTSGYKKLLAMGNLFSSYWYHDGSVNMQILEEANEGKYTFDELEDIIFELSVLSSDPDARPDFYMPVQMAASEQMMVSGRNEGLLINTDGTVESWGDKGYEQDKVGIVMQRSMAHVTFHIIAKPEGADGEFIPSSYTVYNIPKLSYVVNGRDTPKLTPQTEIQKFINYSTTNVPSLSGGKYTFDFYMPENTYNRELKVTEYNQRDTWGAKAVEGVDAVTGATPLQKTWKNAPQNSTFVVIRGTYSGQASVNGSTDNTVTADVSYTIHLGDFSTTGSMGDFSVKRNNSYIYNVSVKGVDNIIVEATVNGKEAQPGAEGAVYDATNMTYSYNLDAHYEQIYLEYNLSDMVETVRASLQRDGIGNNPTDEQLDNAIANQLMLIIQSEAMNHNKNGVSNKRGSLKPYLLYATAIRGKTGTEAEVAAQEAKEGILAGAGEKGVPTKGYDYKWVEFWPQEESNTIAEYPGISEWARDDKTESMNPEEQIANRDYYYANGEESTEKSKKLMDVYDVIVEMGKAVKQLYKNETIGSSDYKIKISDDGNSKVARFTAFVNEYYYLRHPLTGEKTRVWSTFTNKIPRQMIIAISSNISSDGNSSYGKIHSYISQLSMQSFYNSRVNSLAAFGIETYNETPLSTDGFTFGDPKGATGLTDGNGRDNQKILIGLQDGATNWGDFIVAAQNGWTSSENTTTDHVQHKLPHGAYNVPSSNGYYPGAYFACLSRNRDLNGDGKIDESEIHWYLASLNEYIRMGIGSNGISNAAQLYIGDKQAMEKVGYAGDYINQGSLFYTSSGESENSNERLFWAVEKGSYGPDGKDWTGKKAPKPIRCIRTLPKLDTEKGTDISSFTIINNSTGNIESIVADPVYEKIERNVDGMLVLKFKDRLVDQLYRQQVLGSLNPHTEDDFINSFYEGIFVATGDDGIKTGLKFGNIIGADGYTMTNPCSNYKEGGYTTGWRVPNLVEFLVMDRAGLLDSDQMCCTKFSNQEVRFGFYYSSDKIIMCEGEKYSSMDELDKDETKSYKVRCVRDVPANYFSNNGN